MMSNTHLKHFFIEIIQSYIFSNPGNLLSVVQHAFVTAGEFNNCLGVAVLVSMSMKMNHRLLTKDLTGGGHTYLKHFNEDMDL